MNHAPSNLEPRPSSLERRVGLRYDDLKPEVRSYVDKLHVQIDTILHKYGVKNPQEFAIKIKEKGSKIEPKERTKVIELVGALIEAYRKDETPSPPLYPCSTCGYEQYAGATYCIQCGMWP